MQRERQRARARGVRASESCVSDTDTDTAAQRLIIIVVVILPSYWATASVCPAPWVTSASAGSVVNGLHSRRILWLAYFVNSLVLLKYVD